MKVLNVALVALLCVVSLTVGGCRKHHWSHDTVYVNVPDPIVTNTNVVTPGGITIVEIVDPNGKLQDPAFNATILADLDYQVLYVWYQRELNETNMDFKTWVKSARFHLVIDCSFKVNQDRNVHYAVLPAGFDIYLAALRQSSDGHYCADADRAMDLLSGDANEGHDRHSGKDFLLFDAPSYPTTGYLSLQ
jgi:hypothetical protein